MNSVLSLSHDVGKRPACEALHVPRATFYRHHSANNKPSQQSIALRHQSPQALDAEQRQAVIEILHSDRFLDDTLYQIYATLLDEGQYYCSIRTMYRILTAQHGNVIERRKHVQRSAYVKPELLATAPNEVWSWDITKLKGPGEVDILSSVRHYRYLQPLRCRLDGRSPGTGCFSQTVYRGKLHKAEH